MQTVAPPLRQNSIVGGWGGGGVGGGGGCRVVVVGSARDLLWRIEHTQVGVYTLVLSVRGALPWRCLVYHTACLPVRPDCKKGITHTL